MKKTKAVVFFLVVAFILSLSTLVFASDKTITIFHTNDMHGRFVGDSAIIGIDTIAQIKLDTPNSILVDAGDTLHGLPFVTLNRGVDAVTLLNAAGYDIFTPGNHDYNYGYETLLSLAELAEFDIISANVTKDGNHVFTPWVVKEIDGVKVGFFGLSTPETTYKTNPLNVLGIVFEDVVAAAETAVAELQAQGVDLIVGLVHLGVDTSSVDTSIRVAEAVPAIDVIIDGHSHTLFEEGYLANGVLIASAKEYEGYVGRVEITLDSDNNVVGKAASVINHSAARENYSANEILSAKIEEIKAEQSLVLDVVVAELAYSLSAAREPGVRTQEMPLGNLAADAIKTGTGAQIAITNGGGLRADLNEGAVTKGDIIAVLPFGNYGVTMYVTPAQLKEALENGIASAPASAGKFPQVSGFSFTYNPNNPAGSRVIEIIMDGTALDLTDTDAKILLATNDFMAVGGDEYTVFADIPTENEFNAMDELLLTYMINNPGKSYAEAEGRTVALGDSEIVSVEETQTGVVVINCYSVFVRSGAGVSKKAINHLKVGAVVTVLETYKGWVKITTGDVTGWVYGRYLNIN